MSKYIPPFLNDWREDPYNSMVLNQPTRSHFAVHTDAHNSRAAIEAKVGCPVCRATIIPAKDPLFGKYRTYGDYVDGKEGEVSSYIIWNPSAKVPPTKEFSSRPEAIKIAHKLSAENPGERFYIAKLVGLTETPVAQPRHTQLD